MEDYIEQSRLTMHHDDKEKLASKNNEPNSITENEKKIIRRVPCIKRIYPPSTEQPVNNSKN